MRIRLFCLNTHSKPKAKVNDEANNIYGKLYKLSYYFQRTVKRFLVLNKKEMTLTRYKKRSDFP